jgi:hypothetical protein
MRIFKFLILAALFFLVSRLGLTPWPRRSERPPAPRLDMRMQRQERRRRMDEALRRRQIDAAIWREQEAAAQQFQNTINRLQRGY